MAKTGPSHRSLLALPIVALLLSGITHAISNPNFETVPNEAWLTDPPGTKRVALGDSPFVAVGARQNRYGHIGDADGKEANGENFSRFFQWVVSEDNLPTNPHLTVSFRFRSLVLDGEVAWVRLRSTSEQSVVLLPNSNNRWAAGRRSVTLPNGCRELESIYLEFGMVREAGGNIAGRLSIDDVRHRCDAQSLTPGEDRSWSFLPAVPEQNSVRVVQQQQVSKTILRQEGSLGLAALAVAGILVLLWRARSK